MFRGGRAPANRLCSRATISRAGRRLISIATPAHGFERRLPLRSQRGHWGGMFLEPDAPRRVKPNANNPIAVETNRHLIGAIWRQYFNFRSNVYAPFG